MTDCLIPVVLEGYYVAALGFVGDLKAMSERVAYMGGITANAR